MRQRTAFTLVELLVVIGILTLLMSILLPTFSSARANADKLKCLNNMRQIGQTIIMYMGDYKRSLPGPSWVGQTASYRTGDQKLALYLAPYATLPPATSTPQRNKLFVCPAAERIVPEDFTTFSLDKGATEYRMAPGAPAVKLFGYPKFQGQPMKPPRKYPAVLSSASSQPILREVDEMNVAGDAVNPWPRPAKPVHGREAFGSRRAKLFFDFHVEMVTEKDAFDLQRTEL